MCYCIGILLAERLINNNEQNLAFCHARVVYGRAYANASA